MRALRLTFAAMSWFLAFGLLILAFRYPGQAAGMLFLCAAFSANGMLHWSAAKRVAPEYGL